MSNLDNDDLIYITNQFSLFSKFNKIKIIKENTKSIPVYLEIINSLKYIEQIQDIINKYPKNYGNHLGTKHRSSSYINILKKQLYDLENRLNNPFFPLEIKNEIKKVKIQIKFIKTAMNMEYKNFPEWFNFASIYFGFDNGFFNFTDLEQQALKQLLSFFNGIRTSKEEKSGDRVPIKLRKTLLKPIC